MCRQVTELYRRCNCLYYVHAVDRCPAYGRPGHKIRETTIHIGYACSDHSDHRQGRSPASPLLDLHDDLSSRDIKSIFHLLLQDLKLGLLWPQVIRLAGSPDVAYQTVNAFIQGFLGDVGPLLPLIDAYTDIPTFGSHRNPRDHFHSQVLRFLLSGKGDIAQSILEFHQHFIDTESKFVPLDKEDGRRQGGCSPAWSADGFEPGISAEFRFLRSPLKSMESRIQDYIRQSPRPNPLTQPIQILLVQLLNRLEARKWRNAAISDGARRIEWTCKCGRKIFDDYETFHPEGASVVFPLLEKNLKTYPSVATSLSSESSEGSGATTAAQTRNLSITSFFRGLAVSLTSLKGPALPQHNNTSPADPARLGVCPQPAETDPRRGTHTFLLLCLPFMRTAIKLLQLETCTIYSDREFFRALAYHYSASRGRTSWARLRKVRSLKFVEFEVFQSELVNIRQCPSLPPESLRMSEYTYQPALAVPPIGSNLLTHLFENPDHAEVLPVLFQRIPRKLRSRLTACQRKGSAVGWGIQVDEGLNWVGLLVWGSVGFFVCLAIALGWTLARDDAQGGFAIASFVLTFLVFCGGLAHAEMASW